MSLTTAKPTLILDLIEVFSFEAASTDDPQTSRQRIAEKLADAIENFIKNGDVKVNVTTTGSATAQTGTGFGKIE